MMPGTKEETNRFYMGVLLLPYIRNEGLYRELPGVWDSALPLLPCREKDR
jgi:hypothetical protein